MFYRNHMKFQSVNKSILASLLVGFCLFTGSVYAAGDAKSFDIAEFHKILDSIEQSNIPENVKDQLFRDMKTTMIENVRQADISEAKKSKLIKDLQSTKRK